MEVSVAILHVAACNNGYMSVNMMFIPVVLKDGHEELVSKDELQYLLFTKQVLFFKRFEGWVVIGRDQMRQMAIPYTGSERRQHEVFSLDF